eukprot:1590032-Pyramimonas_sp.AAC.1
MTHILSDRQRSDKLARCVPAPARGALKSRTILRVGERGNSHGGITGCSGIVFWRSRVART